MAKKKAKKKAARTKGFTVRVKSVAASPSMRTKRIEREVDELMKGHRDGAGRFKAGNPGGPGNPMAARANQLRSIMLNATDPDLIAKAWLRCQVEAANGNVECMRIAFPIVMPKNVQIDVSVKAEFEQKLALVVKGAAASMIEEAAAADEQIRRMMEEASAGNGRNNQVQPAALPR